jgi:hypothetical protein
MCVAAGRARSGSIFCGIEYRQTRIKIDARAVTSIVARSQLQNNIRTKFSQQSKQTNSGGLLLLLLVALHWFLFGLFEGTCKGQF